MSKIICSTYDKLGDVLKKYKVCVYAISKNEEKFVKRWYESMKEADKIIVLDTGSTDKTVDLLKECGVEVYEEAIMPWRFDVARNRSLNLVPEEYDICVCTDLDEVFEPGWKEKILSVWKDDTTRIRYTYNWSFDEYGSPATTFLLNKIHLRNNYKWTHPVHEVLTSLNVENETSCEDIVLNHYPDNSKSRSSYLPLLELSVKEDPEDDRNVHYLGREYMYYQRWDDCIRTLKKHLTLKSATWKDERSASMRFIARSYYNLNEKELAKSWFLKSIQEAPHLREGYVELGALLYGDEGYLEAYYYLRKALEIEEKSKSYINEQFAWNAYIYDLISMCAYKLEFYKEAYDYIRLAVSLDYNNERLLTNLFIMRASVN